MPLAAPTGGGGTSGDGEFLLVGAIGQPAAGTLSSSEFRAEIGVLAGGDTLLHVILPNLAKDK